jgi:hypothetical protein
MKKPKYEAPRAVKLSDAKTAGLSCTNGRTGNMEYCLTGFGAGQHNICANGLLVRN